jgi:hypothetical protein
MTPLEIFSTIQRLQLAEPTFGKCSGVCYSLYPASFFYWLAYTPRLYTWQTFPAFIAILIIYFDRQASQCLLFVVITNF